MCALAVQYKNPQDLGSYVVDEVFTRQGERADGHGGRGRRTENLSLAADSVEQGVISFEPSGDPYPHPRLSVHYDVHSPLTLPRSSQYRSGRPLVTCAGRPPPRLVALAN